MPAIHERPVALEIFKRYNKSASLLKHALAVEAVMRHFAEKFDEDPDYWGEVGLLHDIDYEMHPDEHCKKAVEILGAEGYDEAFIHAVVSHGYGIVVDVKPEAIMEKALFAADELTGLVMAAALMRPSKSVVDMELKSLKKKWKDKRFAAGVNRDIIVEGCQMLGLNLDEVMTETMAALKKAAPQLEQ